MTYEFMRTSRFEDSIDIEDIGNVTLQAFNDDGQEYYLIIQTHLGETTIKQFGPLVVDSDILPNYFSYIQLKREYNEKKIDTTIDNFLNNPKYIITQVFFTEPDVAMERLEGVHEE